MRVNGEQLMQVMRWLKPALAKKGCSLPALRGVRITSLEGSPYLYFTTTNIEVALTFKLFNYNSNDVDRAVVVDYDQLLKVVRRDDYVTLEVDEEGKVQARTSSLPMRSELLTYDAEDFPDVAMLTPHRDPELRLAASTWDLLRDRIVPITASDGSRPVLAGVNVAPSGSYLQFSAADGFMLVDHLSSDRTTLEENIVIPRDTFKALPKKISNIRCWVSENRAQLSVAFVAQQRKNDHYEGFAVSRLIDGHFPDVRHIIPEQFTEKAVVRRDVLDTALDRKFGNDSAPRMLFKPGLLKVAYGDGQETVWENPDVVVFRSLEVEKEESSLTSFALSPEYLKKAMPTNGNGSVSILGTNANSAFALRENMTTYVIMPMVLND